MDKKTPDNLTPQSILAFSSAATATASIVAICTYAFLSKRIVQEPQDILQRCQDAIKNIEKELERS